MDRSPCLLLDPRHVSAPNGRPDGPRRRRTRRIAQLIVPVVMTASVPAACGGGDPASDLSPAAAAGRAVYVDKGCAACHGTDGGGRVGPSLAGLIGRERVFEDAAPRVADRDYVIESILEPSAKVVDGYGLPMPRVTLTDAELASLVEFIEALTPSPGDGS